MKGLMADRLRENLFFLSTASIGIPNAKSMLRTVIAGALWGAFVQATCRVLGAHVHLVECGFEDDDGDGGDEDEPEPIRRDNVAEEAPRYDLH